MNKDMQAVVVAACTWNRQVRKRGNLRQYWSETQKLLVVDFSPNSSNQADAILGYITSRVAKSSGFSRTVTQHVTVLLKIAS